ncbi:MAG: VanZ family protein [Erysipelotrichaceae bacterium]|nr:VanZ family protein [Erysipelotrichaceae bacterium]
MGVHFTTVPTNIFVTILMIVMVVFMPAVDHYLSKKFEISLDDSLSENPNADHLLRIRKLILIIIFLLYLAILAYVTFFSRSAAQDYLLHISFYQDLAESIKIDVGVLGLIRLIFTEGPAEALSHIKVVNFDDLSQVYLNVVMFIPLGYLLPYVFDFYRTHIRTKVVFTSFLLTMIIENLQLITKRGFYDTDDIISNTLGGFIGAQLYILFAYVLTHPNFRQEMKDKFKWHMKARDKAIYPFLGKTHLERLTLLAHDKNEILEFYENKLGLRLQSSIDYENESFCIFDYNEAQIEFHISKDCILPKWQHLVIACNNSHNLKKRLTDMNIETSDYFNDPYTNLRSFNIPAPYNTIITIIEE